MNIHVNISPYTTIQMFGVVFQRFKISVLCSTSLHLFDQKYSINSNICEILLQLKFSLTIYFKF